MLRNKVVTIKGVLSISSSETEVKENVDITTINPGIYLYNYSDRDKNKMADLLSDDIAATNGSGDLGSGLYVSTNGYDSQYYGPILARLTLHKSIEVLNFPILWKAVSKHQKDVDDKKKITKEKVVQQIEIELRSELANKVYAVCDPDCKSWLKIRGTINSNDWFEAHFQVEVNPEFSNRDREQMNTVNWYHTFRPQFSPIKRDAVLLDPDPNNSSSMKAKSPPYIPDSFQPCLELEKVSDTNQELYAEQLRTNEQALRIFALDRHQSFADKRYFFMHYKNDFLYNLIRTFEFIDYYDLLKAFAENNPTKTPWDLYQADKGSERDLNNWMKAIKTGREYYELISKGENNANELLGLIVLLNKIISGEMPPEPNQGRDYLSKLIEAKNFYKKPDNDDRKCPGGGRVKCEETKDRKQHGVIVEDDTDNNPEQIYQHSTLVDDNQLQVLLSDPDIKLYKTEIKHIEPVHDARHLVRVEYNDDKKFERCLEAISDLKNKKGKIKKSKIKTSLEGLYLKLIKIHPFSNHNGRTLRAFFYVVAGYPLFMRNWNFDYFMTLEEFKTEIEEGRTWRTKIIAGFMREIEAAEAKGELPKFYDTPALWLSLLNIDPDTVKEENDKNTAARLVINLKKWINNDSELAKAFRQKAHFHIMDILKNKLLSSPNHLKSFLRPRLLNYAPRKVIFSLYAPGLSNVNKIYLRGDFNNWAQEKNDGDKKKWQMQPVAQNKNHYCLTTRLYPGLYQYKFFIEFRNYSSQWIPPYSGNLACKINSGDTPLAGFCYFNNHGAITQPLHLKGNFNNWGNPEATVMIKRSDEGNTLCRITLSLPSNDHPKFKYFMNGKWLPEDEGDLTLKISDKTDAIQKKPGKTKHLCFLSTDNTTFFQTSAIKTKNGINQNTFDGEVILQVFDWNSAKNYENDFYKNLKKSVPDIKQAGFTAVWMPPPWRETLPHWKKPDPSDKKAKNKVGYLWIDFNKNSAYGKNKELKELAGEFKEAGIKVIYDLVINHRDTKHAGAEGIGTPWCGMLLDEQTIDPQAKKDAGLEVFGNGNDLDLRVNGRVFNAFVDEIVNLILNYSAGGFRFDMAKGYPPETVTQLIEKAKEAIPKERMPELFLVAEYWSEDKRQLIKWSKKSSCKMFDFPLQGQLHQSHLYNNGLNQGLNAHPVEKRRRTAVTFADSHDTGYSEEHDDKTYDYEKRKPIPDSIRKVSLTYLLLSPGIPCVFWPHWHTWGEKDGSHQLINELIKIRKALGINACSEITFNNNHSPEGVFATVKGSRGDITICIGIGIEENLRQFEGGKTYFAKDCGFIHFHDNDQGEKIMKDLNLFTTYDTRSLGL